MERVGRESPFSEQETAAKDTALDFATTLPAQAARAAQAAQAARTTPPPLGAQSPDGLPADMKIGRYQLLHCLGQGGMGAVYAAWDPQLSRQVALKLLHDDGAGGSSQAAHKARLRLQREAQAIARLSHPNVVAVYDVGHLGDEVFVAMELVDGGTVRTWLAERRRSWREILEVFLAAGRGLQAAHAAGLVHRDFKPENVLVGHDGRVRVADFGLARTANTPSSSDEEDAPSLPVFMQGAQEAQGMQGPLALPLTRTGAVLGTPLYMAPEQFHGGTVDARTDQFSFCVALYRALYGVLPFGEGPLEVLAPRVMAGKLLPPPRKTAGSGPVSGPVPKWLTPILARGLKAIPEDRFPSMEALLAALDPRPRALRRRWALGGFAAALAFLGAGLSIAHRGAGPGHRMEAQPARIPQHRKLTTDGNVTEAVLSPDGKTLAYVSGGRRLVRRRLETGEERDIFHANRIIFLRWSPSSAELLFQVRADGEKTGGWLWSGAGPQRLDVSAVTAWSPDGQEIAHTPRSGKAIHVTRWRKGTERSIPLAGPYGLIRDMDWSPDGARLLVSTEQPEHVTLSSVSTDGSRQEPITVERELWSPRWSQQGKAIYYFLKHQDGMDLLRARLDPLSGRARNPAEVLLTGLDTALDFSLTRERRDLVYTKTQKHANLWLLDVELHGQERTVRRTRLTSGTTHRETPTLSPDGSTVAFLAATGGSMNLFTIPITGGAERQLTFFRTWSSRIGPPAFSPDGKEIAFATGEGGTVRVWRISMAGGLPRPFPHTTASEVRAVTWAPGAKILYQAPGNRSYLLLDPQTEEERPLPNDEVNGFAAIPRYSPDGQRVVFSGFRQGVPMVWIVSLPDGAVTLLQTPQRLAAPVGWSADARWVYMEQETSGDDEVLRLPAAGGKPEHWVTLPLGQDSGCAHMTADGGRFVCAIQEGESDAWLVEDFDGADAQEGS